MEISSKIVFTKHLGSNGLRIYMDAIINLSVCVFSLCIVFKQMACWRPRYSSSSSHGGYTMVPISDTVNDAKKMKMSSVTRNLLYLIAHLDILS